MSHTYAAIVLTPGGIISWLVVGLIAGWLAGVVMKGGGFDRPGRPGGLRPDGPSSADQDTLITKS